MRSQKAIEKLVPRVPYDVAEHLGLSSRRGLSGTLFLSSVRILAKANSEYLAELCVGQACEDPANPILDFDKETGSCVCASHPCWNDNGLEHTCRGKFGFPYLTFFYNETKHLVCECSSFAHYGSTYISRDLCAGHRCVDPEHPVLDYDLDSRECVCKSHGCWNDNGRRHTCSDKPHFPILTMRYDKEARCAFQSET
eukprot:Skav211604  [mRNA]  locus=scaffold2962:156659:158358:- [translate_table: standard]